MSTPKMPSTPAVLALRAAKVEFTPHFYNYEDRGGTAVSSRELGVDEHAVVKTLIMQDEAAKPCVVLMHGDRQVSAKALARQSGDQTHRALQTGSRRTPYRLPRRRHLAFRHAPQDAGVSGAEHP